LHLQPVPQGTFYNWLRSKGKYGGQHKVPRLANDRKYVDEILHFLEEKVSSGFSRLKDFQDSESNKNGCDLKSDSDLSKGN